MANRAAEACAGAASASRKAARRSRFMRAPRSASG
jgi:hypothetical protein